MTADLMHLVHYSDAPLGKLELRTPAPPREFFKPHGLWVSDDDCEDNWREWCLSERFGLDRLTHVHDVELAPGADVLILQSAPEIDAFTREWRREDELRYYALRWPDIQARYAGLVITPYIWERRLYDGVGWYYGWDCASGCIWNPSAIASVVLREVVPVPLLSVKQ